MYKEIHVKSGRIYVGDAIEVLKNLPEGSFSTCITSPPYWGLRDYGIEGQIGAEDSLEKYLQKLVVVFRDVRRVLREDGTLWLNIGDGYTSGNRGWRDEDKKNPARGMSYRPPTPIGLKPKDLLGVPWRLALALQDDGWYLRSEVIWHKPNAQPESVKDRPTRAHEHIFMLTRSEKYFYNYEAVQEPSGLPGMLRNRRSVWSINTEPFMDAHFATFPTKLVEPCVVASSKVGDSILDPFFGSGTVGQVCKQLGRVFTGIELNDEYTRIALKRLGEHTSVLV